MLRGEPRVDQDVTERLPGLEADRGAPGTLAEPRVLDGLRGDLMGLVHGPARGEQVPENVGVRCTGGEPCPLAENRQAQGEAAPRHVRPAAANTRGRQSGRNAATAPKTSSAPGCAAASATAPAGAGAPSRRASSVRRAWMGGAVMATVTAASARTTHETATGHAAGARAS